MPNSMEKATPNRSLLVDRGEAEPLDWTDATLTLDDDFHDLDCSGIVPPGTKWILFHGLVQTDDPTDYIQVKHPSYNSGMAAFGIFQDVASVQRYQQFLLPCPENRIMDLAGLKSGTGLIVLSIIGWVI